MDTTSRRTNWVDLIADYCSRCGNPRKLPVYSKDKLVLSCTCSKDQVNQEESSPNLFTTALKLSGDVGKMQSALMAEDYGEALILLFKIAARAKEMAKNEIFDAVWEDIDAEDDTDLGDE